MSKLFGELADGKAIAPGLSDLSVVVHREHPPSPRATTKSLAGVVLRCFPFRCRLRYPFRCRSPLSRQCLNRRIESMVELKQEVSAWEQERNERQVVVKWQFTTAD